MDKEQMREAGGDEWNTILTMAQKKAALSIYMLGNAYAGGQTSLKTLILIDLSALVLREVCTTMPVGKQATPSCPCPPNLPLTVLLLCSTLAGSAECMKEFQFGASPGTQTQHTTPGVLHGLV